MKDPVVHEALRQIQDIVAQETGNPLAGTAKSRVQRVLSSALGQLAGVRGEDKHLTRDVTILLADLRGFTTISANYPAVIVLVTAVRSPRFAARCPSTTPRTDLCRRTRPQTSSRSSPGTPSYPSVRAVAAHESCADGSLVRRGARAKGGAGLAAHWQLVARRVREES